MADRAIDHTGIAEGLFVLGTTITVFAILLIVFVIIVVVTR